MRIIIDRFEADRAIAELPDGTTVSLPKVLFEEFSEGDAAEIIKTDNSDLKNKVKELMRDVWED